MLALAIAITTGVITTIMMAADGIHGTAAGRVGLCRAVLDLSTSNGRIVIDDPTVGAFSFVVPAADLGSVQPGHYRVDLLVFQPGKVKTVFTGSVDVVAGETMPAQ